MNLSNILDRALQSCPETDLPALFNHNELQRTPEWFEARRGIFTGSETSKLMTCSRATGKMEWGRVEKIIDFGETAVKYIYSKAMERKTGKVIEMSDIFQFRYGRAAEPAISLLFQKKGHVIKPIDVPFILVPGHEKYLGASPDGMGVVVVNGEKVGIEYKGAMNWGTYYERAETPVDQSQTDFWQLQTEMLALGVTRLFYVTGHPPVNAQALIAEESIEKRAEMIGDVAVVSVDKSPIHCNALIARAQIGDVAINDWLKFGGRFYDCLRAAATEYQVEMEY